MSLNSVTREADAGCLKNSGIKWEHPSPLSLKLFQELKQANTIVTNSKAHNGALYQEEAELKTMTSQAILNPLRSEQAHGLDTMKGK